MSRMLWTIAQEPCTETTLRHSQLWRGQSDDRADEEDAHWRVSRRSHSNAGVPGWCALRGVHRSGSLRPELCKGGCLVGDLARLVGGIPQRAICLACDLNDNGHLNDDASSLTSRICPGRMSDYLTLTEADDGKRFRVRRSKLS